MLKKLIVPLFAMMCIAAAAQQKTIQMKDEDIIRNLYAEMYSAMIDKDIETLSSMLDDGFVLVHMTGMCQPKQDYLKYIANGTLNYYSCDDSSVSITVNADKAQIIGKSHVIAAVFGSGKHRWSLQLNIALIKRNGEWLLTEAVASTF